MNLGSQGSRVLIVGKNGRLSRAILAQLEKIGQQTNSVILSTRENNRANSNAFFNDIQDLQKINQDTIFWCSGSASNRSPQADCAKDEAALKNFLSTYTQRVSFPPVFWYFSSGGSVYGKSPGLVNERSPLKPETAYAEMKVRSEEFLIKLSQEGRIKLRLIRLGNLYGGEGFNHRLSLVDAAARLSEIHLTVNPESAKQYGTYTDYAKYLVELASFSQIDFGQLWVRNLYSEHLYTISDILRLTSSRNPYGENRRITTSADKLSYENVTLDSIDNVGRLNFSWQSIENYLEKR